VQIDRAQVAERLRGENAAGSRQLAAEQPGGQAGRPHAGRSEFGSLVGAGETFIEMGRVQIAGQRGEQLNIPGLSRVRVSFDLLTDGDLGESAIGNGVSDHVERPSKEVLRGWDDCPARLILADCALQH
jgi:hypothetical protein